MSVLDLEARIDRLIEEGFEPGIIIDDYGDLLAPERHYSEHRYELSNIFQFLRDLGSKLHLPVWTASQSTRASHSKEIITMQDVAEDIGKVSISDVIITLNQTYEELQTDQCRLFMAKVRDGPRGACFQAKFMGGSQAIITTGLVERKDEKDA
jgi:replicative DNA helicase